MKTDVIAVSSSGNQIGKALEQVEKMAAYKGLSRKDTLHLRLLTEEMMGMMRSITGEKDGYFWIEDEAGEYQLHLQVNTMLNWEWSMLAYQETLSKYTAKDEKARAMWDELEKSVVTHVADDVKVAIRGQMAEMTIIKRIG